MKHLIALSLLLVACAKKEHAKEYSVPTDIGVYVASFVEASRLAGHPIVIDDLVIEMVEDINGGEFDGFCTRGETPHIRIAAKNWTVDLAQVPETDGRHDYVEASREILIWHELGHCILSRQHTDAVSIMHARSSPAMALDFSRQRQGYILELFD